MCRLLIPLVAGALLAPAVPAAADHVAARRVTTACPDNQVGANPFADVAASSPFELAISCLADQGIARGRTATSYAPAGTVLRQQMAQFLHRLGSRAGIAWDTSDAGFQDLGGLSAEARAAIDALANAGVAQGRSATVFDPAGVVTRAQMASFLARLADAAGTDGFASEGNAFDDDEELVHEPSIDRIAAAGVTAGRGSDRFFDPFSAVTREQMAAFLARTLDSFVDQGLAQGHYRGDVAPVAVVLDQAGQLVEAGSALTGRLTGDRLRSASLTSPCVGTVEIGRELSVPTDRQSPAGWCPVSVTATFDNGRSRTELLHVVMPGWTALPELVHVERAGTSTEQGHMTSQIRFLFDAPMTLPAVDPDSPSPFVLQEYYGEGHAAVDLRQESDRSVLATFGTDEHPVGPVQLRAVSHATAFRGAVLDPQGRPAPATAAQLDPRSSSADAYAGPLWEPDLLSVTDRRADPVRPDRFLVDFLFDALLPRQHPGEYGVDIDYLFDVVLSDGTGRRCVAQTPLPAQRITAACDEALTDPAHADQAIARGVVSTRGYETDYPLAATLLTRRPTAGPDLTFVQWGPQPNQITFAFDEPVHAGDPGRYRTKGPRSLFSGTGHRAEVAGADPRVVVVTLSGNEIDKNTLASALGGAVTSRATGRTNVFEQVQVAARVPHVVPAGSAGRNLLGLTVDENAAAHYDFDSYFFPAEHSGQIEVDLRLYTPDGVELVCEQAGYDEDETDPTYSTNLACGSFTVGEPAVDRSNAATADQVRSATYGTGEGVGRRVEGAQR